MECEVVINKCYGGFSLSKKGFKYFNDLRRNKGLPEEKYYFDIPRGDPDLIQTVKDLGNEANGRHANLRIVNAKVPYEIDEYDGLEDVYFSYETFFRNKLKEIKDIINSDSQDKILKIQKLVEELKI